MTTRTRELGVVCEALLVLLAFFFAVLLRLGDVSAALAYPNLLPKALACVLVVLASLYYGELYDRPAHRRAELFLRIGQCMTFAGVTLAVLGFLVRGLAIGRGIFVVFMLLAWSALLVWRLVVLWSWSGLAGIGDSVLILGTGPFAQKVAREMLKRSPMGGRVLGFLSEYEHEVGRVLVNPSVIGTLSELPVLAERYGASLIVVAQEDRRRRLPVDSLLRCRIQGVHVIEATTLFEGLSGRIPLGDLRPSWLIFSAGFKRPRVLNGVRRAGEAVLSAALLALAAPLLLLVALAVRFSSPGPVLYRQARVGKGGRHFDLLKFRTMRVDAEAASGPVWASGEGDARVTGVGRLLRRTRLDELPQLWNVLAGVMSFVGPRPERPHFVERLRRVIPYYDERHGVRPGITGWAQVRFPYGSTLEDAEEKLEFDLYYVKHRSFLLDVAILLETAKVVLLALGR